MSKRNHKYRKNKCDDLEEESHVKNKYFDSNYYNKILKHTEFNPLLAISLFETYLQTYSTDLSAYAPYASLLIAVGRLDEAKNIIDMLESEVEQNSKYNKVNNGSKVEILLGNILFNKLKYYMYSGNYVEAYNFINNNKEAIIKRLNSSIIFLELFCELKIGIKRSIDEYDKYLYKQIMDYSEARFLEHIKKHFHSCDNEEDLDYPEEKYSKFYTDFPFAKIYAELKKYIPGNTRLYRGIMEDTYFFKYDNCGKVDGVNTDYFTVKAFHDACEFITMYPTIGAETLPYIDLNFLRQEENAPMKRRLSQIDKFNKKYGKEMH